MSQSVIKPLLDSYQPGFTLPAEFYNSQDVMDQDIEVFRNNWFYAATICDMKEEGDFYVVEVGEESIVLVNDGDEIKGYFNTCCHRGAQLCTTDRGSCSRLVCHYHQWTYDFEGQLIYAGEMGTEFDMSDYKLQPVHVENIGGMIFVCMAENPPEDIAEVKKRLGPYVEPYDFGNLKVAHEQTIIEQANWKLVLENNRECYHCSTNHPELLVPLLPYGFGFGLAEDEGDSASCDAEYEALTKRKEAEWEAMGLPYKLQEFDDGLWFRTARLPLADGAESHTLDGKPTSNKFLAPFDKAETSGLSIWTYPNSWHHFLSDHIVTFCVTPISPTEAQVRTKWLVREDAVEGEDYDVDHLTHVWIQTNFQDQELAESTQRGTKSKGYRVGPYSQHSEKLVQHFVDWYVGELHRQNEEPLPIWNGDHSPLQCIEIRDDTADVKTFVFQPTEPARFDFKAGQYITFSHEIDGQPMNRTYTISSPPSRQDTLTVTIKRVEGGLFSNWMHDYMYVGTELDAMGPGGEFGYKFVKSPRKKLLMLSGGSGITPMLSMTRHILDRGLDYDIHFLHSARSVNDFIAGEELKALETQHDNFTLTWVCDDPTDWDGATGFLNKELLAELAPDFAARETFCCGPAPYMENVKSVLKSLNFDMKHHHEESFDFTTMMEAMPGIGVPEVAEVIEAGHPETEDTGVYEITFTKRGKTIQCDSTTPIMEAAAKAGVRLPSSCSNGICGTCRTLMTEGEVEMYDNGGLLKKDKNKGYILPCCSTPKSNVTLDF